MASRSLLQLLRPFLRVLPLLLHLQSPFSQSSTPTLPPPLILLHLLEEVEGLAGIGDHIGEEEEAERAEAAIAVSLRVPDVQLQAARVGVQRCPVVSRPIEVISSHL
eukprot:57676-Hanusia_phi.AAC.2